MSSKKIYDVSPQEEEIALWRDAKRKQLRELYLKQSEHPTKSLLFDTGIYRYASAKTSLEVHFIPTALNYLTRMGVVIALITVTALHLKRSRGAKEHLYRTGQVSYADRQFKFN
nr:PREDICTED: uncharacterized protein LOC105668928 [Linepithema humile]